MGTAWKSTWAVWRWTTMVRGSVKICVCESSFLHQCGHLQVLQRPPSWHFKAWKVFSVTNTLKPKIGRRCSRTLLLQSFLQWTTPTSQNQSTLPFNTRYHNQECYIFYSVFCPPLSLFFFSDNAWIWFGDLCVLESWKSRGNGQFNGMVKGRLLGYVLQWKLYCVQLLSSLHVCPHSADSWGIQPFIHYFQPVARIILLFDMPR